LLAGCLGLHLPQLAAVGLAGVPLHLLHCLLFPPAAPSCQPAAAGNHRRRWVLPLPLLVEVFLLLLNLLPLLVLPLLLMLFQALHRCPLPAASC
jgi:hypothetical protein